MAKSHYSGGNANVYANRREYNAQWVYIINCEEGQYGETTGGEVVLHSERRAKVIQEMAQYRGDTSRSLIFYAGKIPEGVSVIL
jgi:hypothetical protein